MHLLLQDWALHEHRWGRELGKYAAAVEDRLWGVGDLLPLLRGVSRLKPVRSTSGVWCGACVEGNQQESHRFGKSWHLRAVNAMFEGYRPLSNRFTFGHRFPY